jgi:anti-sigma B factor antagonist
VSLDISVKKDQGSSQLRIVGEVDMYSSPQVRRALLELIKQKQSPIIIDLNEVGYMDSSGVATLIEGLQMCAEYNGTLLIVGLRDNVREVFELTRLDKIFKIYQNIEAAMAR